MKGYYKYLERIRKEEEYREYISEHINNVKMIWYAFASIYWGLEGMSGFFSITEQISHHDASKYNEEEFVAYRKQFYPFYENEKDEAAFITAWHHHMENNKHHWEHWVIPEVEKNIAIEMPYCYMIEMLCDWTAMSLKFNNNTVSGWYQKNKSKMILHSYTQEQIEELLPQFDQALEKVRGDGTRTARIERTNTENVREEILTTEHTEHTEEEEE